MSLYRKLRAKAASSISSFEQAEDFLWNRWLRVPPVIEEEVGSLSSRLNPNDKLHRKIPFPSHFGFDIILPKSRVFRLRNKSFTTKSRVIRIFFGLGETYVENYISRLFGETEILFSGEIMSEGSDQYISSKAMNSASSVQRMNTDINTIDFLDSVRDDPKKYWSSPDSTSNGGHENGVSEFKGKKISTNFPLTRSDYFDPWIEYPGTTDLLKPMYPEVFKLKLLELGPDGKESAVKIELLEKYPDVDLLPCNNFGVVIKMTEYFSGFDNYGGVATYSFPDKLFVKRTSINGYEINNILPQTKKQELNRLRLAEEIATTDIDSTSVFNSLQPEVEISDELKSALYEDLADYQIEAAEYLTVNRRALLTGKPGAGKSVEAVAALRYLFRKREVKNVLILSDEVFISGEEISSATGNITGWEAVINKFAPELSDLVIVRDSASAADKNGNDKAVQIFSHQVFFEKLAEKLTSVPPKVKFDCIIIDEVQLLSKNKQRLQSILDKTDINYLWILTSMKVESIKEIFSASLLSDSHFETKFKRDEDKPVNIIRQNFWTSLDKDQKMEYDISLFDGKNGMIDIYKTGNPYRLQSKILMVLHNLNQVCNFYSDKDDSPKSRLLLHHIDTISSRKQKAVIFTQYDKQGVKKIAAVLEKKNISFLILKRGMNHAEIKETEEKFNKDDSVSVLIADSHANGINFSGLITDYVIHFDRWWIPAAQWTLDREFLSSRENDEKPLVIYNYLTKDLIEEKIIRLLNSKGLLESAVFDTYGIDKFNRLITGEEWLKMFDLAVEKKAGKITKEVLANEVTGEEDSNEENPDEQDLDTQPVAEETAGDTETVDEHADKSDVFNSLTHEERIRLIAKFFNVLGYDLIKIFNSEECSSCRIVDGTFSSKGVEFEMASVVNLSINGIDEKGTMKLLKKIAGEEKYQRIFLITLTDFPYDGEKLKDSDVTYIPLQRLTEYLDMLDLI